jgi:dephospho-CoA kinase
MKPYCLGLTGSIGMGKTTTAAMFAAEGIPVWDADAAVYRLYSPGAAGTRLIASLFPDAVVDDTVSRPRLRALILADPTVIDRLGAAIHPLVAEDRAKFLQDHPTGIVVLDIPLLFEAGTDAICDATVVATVAPEIQRRRVLARKGMTEAEFEAILARQMPDAEKRARATWVVDTSTMDAAHAAVRQILAEIRESQAHA